MSVVARRYYERGMKSLVAGDAAGACEAFASAVDLAPSFVDARCAFVAALCRRGNPGRAAQVARAGLARRNPLPSEAALWASLGDALVANGDFTGAADAFEQAGKQLGFKRRAAAGLARVRAKTGRYADAFAALLVASGPGD